MKPRYLIALVVLIVPIALAAARPAAPRAPLFSHRQHLDSGASCGDCHAAPAKGTGGGKGAAGVKGSAPVLNRAACKDCHDAGAPVFRPRGPGRRGLALAFPHETHAAKLACAACHGGTQSDATPAPGPVLRPEQCFACHAARKVPVAETACARCHGVDERTVRPASHGAAWLMQHGPTSRFADVAPHGQSCAACHRDNSCTTCHKTQRPPGHTELFATRTHGVEADWDRDRCKTCHETSTCVRCHRTTQPLNHLGNWQAVHSLAAETQGNQYCAACHDASFCAACHAGRAQ